MADPFHDKLLTTYTVSITRKDHSVVEYAANAYFTAEQHSELVSALKASVRQTNIILAILGVFTAGLLVAVIMTPGDFKTATIAVFLVCCFGLVAFYFLEMKKHARALKAVCESWGAEGFLYEAKPNELVFYGQANLVSIDIQ
ncbi:hypothetical protein HDU99_008222, partial [Rhizoclosmatium hyalinum]